jgi:hypothetical protein
MKSHHCRHCGDKHDKLKPSYRRWRLDRLLTAVRAIIVAQKDGAYVTAEDVGTQLRARKHLVEQCFHRLNLEGLLSQGLNLPPHDSTRDRWSPVGDSAWRATVYTTRKPNEVCDESQSKLQ